MWKFLSSFTTDHIRTNQLNSLLRFAVSFLLGILYVRSFMTRDQVGILEYGLFLTYTGSFVFTYAYSSSMLSRISIENMASAKSQLNQIFWQLFIIGSLSVVFVFAGLKALPYLNIDFLPSSLHLVVSLIAGMIIFVIPAELYYILFQRSKAYFTYSIAVHGFHFLAIAIALYFKQSIETILWIYFVVNLVKLVVVLYHIRPSLKIDWLAQKNWLIFTAPLILHFILGSTMDYLDGHLVASFFDENQFLFYRYGARELPFSIILLNAISASFIPLLASDINQVSALKIRVRRIMHFIFPISIVLLFIAPFAFRWVYGDDFILSAQVFNFYLLIITSRVLLPHTILYAKKDNMALVWFSAIEFVVNLTLSLLLIQSMGITGVALATVIAFLLNRVLTIFYVRRKYKIAVGSYLPIKEYSIYFALLLVSFFVVQYYFYV